jgi:hypothetical protein
VTFDELRFAAYGFGIGLFVALCVWLLGVWRRRELRADVKRLHHHLHTQMEISHEGSDARRRELDRLRLENENLRISLKAWQQKPGRHELRSLQVYDAAVHRLLESTPGFSMAWEVAMRESEAQMERVDRGFLAFTRRLILPRTSPSSESPVEPTKVEVDK